MLSELLKSMPPEQCDWIFIGDNYSPEMEPGDVLGFIPQIITYLDYRPLKEQINERYAHGGGWHPLKEWEMVDADRLIIKYPGDPKMKPIVATRIHDEIFLLYEHAVVCILQMNGDFEVSRMD